MSDSSAVKVGGAYVEDEDFVPNPADMVKQFNTSGLGASGRIEEVSPVFTVDKVKTAEQVLAALDPDNTAVDSSKVLLPNAVDDNDEAREAIRDAAQARVDKGVVIGEPTPAQKEAAEEGDHLEGLRAEATGDAPQKDAATKAQTASAKKSTAKKAASSDDES